MSIYRRNSGRYAVLVDLDPSALGARRRRSLGTFGTRKDAERAEREALTARDRGVDLAPGVVSIAQLLERIIWNRESLGRGAKTIEEYRRIANLYIVPQIGSVTVAKLRPAMVSAWTATIMERGAAEGKSISAKTARHAFALLSSALRWGVRLELAGRNVCESVEAPKPPRTEAKALRDDEVSRLVAAARGTHWQNFVSIALASGARRGELLALTWADVDLEERRMTIAASLSQTAAKVFSKTTKTDRRRIVPLSSGMAAAFRAQQVMQAVDRLRAGQYYAADSTAVFTDELGKRFTPKSVTNALARLAKGAGIETTSLHALRHTAASFLIGGGVDVRTVAPLGARNTRRSLLFRRSALFQFQILATQPTRTVARHRCGADPTAHTDIDAIGRVALSSCSTRCTRILAVMRRRIERATAKRFAAKRFAATRLSTIVPKGATRKMRETRSQSFVATPGEHSRRPHPAAFSRWRDASEAMRLRGETDVIRSPCKRGGKRKASRSHFLCAISWCDRARKSAANNFVPLEIH